jgi:hypothetical protein
LIKAIDELCPSRPPPITTNAEGRWSSTGKPRTDRNPFFSQSIVPVAEADASVAMPYPEETRLDQTSNVQRSCHLAPEFTSKDTAVWYLFNKTSAI